MEAVGGTHGLDDDVGESAGVEALHLDVVVKGRKVAVQGPDFATAPIVIRVLILKAVL